MMFFFVTSTSSHDVMAIEIGQAISPKLLLNLATFGPNDLPE